MHDLTYLEHAPFMCMVYGDIKNSLATCMLCSAVLFIGHKDKGRDGQLYHMAQPVHPTHTSEGHSVSLGRICCITTAMTTRDRSANLKGSTTYLCVIVPRRRQSYQ